MWSCLYTWSYLHVICWPKKSRNNLTTHVATIIIKLPHLGPWPLLTHVQKCLEKNLKIDEKKKKEPNHFFYHFCSCLILLYAKFWLGSITKNNLPVYVKFHQSKWLCVCLYLCTSENSADCGGLRWLVWNENIILGREFECNVEYI